MIRILLLCFAMNSVLGLAICDDSANNANLDTLANRVNSNSNGNSIVNGINGNGNANAMSANTSNASYSGNTGGSQNPVKPPNTGPPANGDAVNMVPSNH